MITILFWNIRKQPILNRVARIAAGRGVDLVLLAECEAEDQAVVDALSGEGATNWNCPPINAPGRVRVFSRYPVNCVVEHFGTGNGRLTLREVRAPRSESFLLAAVHLPAKAGGWTDQSQSSAARGVAEAIERMERIHTNPRTILIGDLNMTPFAPGMIDGNVFHSFLTRDLAAQKSGRVVDGEPCRRAFFNPMWQFMTDRGQRPPGTYYWKQTVPDTHYWYTLDQVLVRPELLGPVS